MHRAVNKSPRISNISIWTDFQLCTCTYIFLTWIYFIKQSWRWYVSTRNGWDDCPDEAAAYWVNDWCSETWNFFSSENVIQVCNTNLLFSFQVISPSFYDFYFAMLKVFIINLQVVITSDRLNNDSIKWTAI